MLLNCGHLFYILLYGQIVFTNDLRDGQGVLDIDFEIDAAQFMVYSSPSSGDGDSEVDLTST